MSQSRLTNEVWILGATGRVGHAVAARLIDSNVVLVLVGRDRERPREHSWGHASIQWADGTNQEGWLRTGDAHEFTTAVAAEVAGRLLKGEGRPGSYTPGALFGPELAEAVGGEFIIATSLIATSL